jgi:hypothetical protein
MIATGALALFACACGSNNADVPPGLLDAIQKQNERGPGDAASGYPPGPYGSRVGDTVENLCFDGWRNPKSQGYDTNKLDRICLGDFHDDASARLLLVESCAIWCVACRSEYGGSGASRPSLAERLATRQKEGFRVLGTIFQNADSQPATPTDAAAWASEYSLEFPFTVDENHQLGLFTSSAVAPFNLLLDTRTMKVVLELSGDEPSVLFSAADDFLSKPAAP